MSHKSEYTMSAQELIQETIRLRALEKQFTKERGELMQECNRLAKREAELTFDLGIAEARVKELESYLPMGFEAAMASLVKTHSAAHDRALAAEADANSWKQSHSLLDATARELAAKVNHWCDLHTLAHKRAEAAEARLAAVLGAADAFAAWSPTPPEHWRASDKAEFLKDLESIQNAIRAQ